MTKSEQDFHKAHFTAMAEHHADMGKQMAECAGFHKALADHLEVSDPDASASHQDIGKACQAMSDSHAAAGEHCVESAESVGAMPTEAGGPTDKAAGGELQELLAGVKQLLKSVQPLPGGMSVVPRTDRPQLAPRTGQRTQAEAIEKAAVDERLQPVIFDENQAVG